MALRTSRVAVIGAGVAGLVAAIDLGRAGFDVTVFERAASPGGKMREVSVAGRPMDAGPTVFTLREVFDALFADAGETLSDYIKLIPANVLARHAWNSREHLDLFADLQRSADAIGSFAGSREAAGFVRFAAQARRIYSTLDDSFMRASRPSTLELVRRLGLGRIGDLWNIKPFVNLWRSTGRYFRDPRLRQLFARYATYCGSSPFHSPATLMLVAHVEQAGVWYVEGGMHRLAVQLAAVATRKGVKFRYATEATQIHTKHGRVSAVQVAGGDLFAVDAVVCNTDTNALAAGQLGGDVTRSAAATPLTDRSLSAVTWNLVARTAGFELAHHSVFFSADYRAEFDDIFRRHRLPAAPTIYICAQDRRDPGCGANLPAHGESEERLLCLVNAPPTGDSHFFPRSEIDACETQVFESLAKYGLIVQRRADATLTTTPADFNRLFPATGGALYGPASHGWRASFKRPGSRSKVRGLYLAGGSAHPGPGVPMAATSGRLAAASILADYASIAR
jgi:1-hydroxycarotenoid 3,4-desaturase